MKYIIDRSKWVCGGDRENLGESRLLNDLGRMCCLGQICLAHKINTDLLFEVGDPLTVALENNGANVPDWLVEIVGADESGNTKYQQTKIVKEMIMVNDDTHLTQRDREKKLKELTKKAGHTLVFKNALRPKKN